VRNVVLKPKDHYVYSYHECYNLHVLGGTRGDVQTTYTYMHDIQIYCTPDLSVLVQEHCCNGQSIGAQTYVAIAHVSRGVYLISKYNCTYMYVHSDINF
jgi:hypothetical protein